MLQLCSGDNLSINGYMGFVESFSANYPCRFCKMKRADFTNNVYDNENLYRTIANYDADLVRNAVSETGVKESCCFNKLYDSSGFHCTLNYVVDMSHDILEGVANYLLPKLLAHLIYEAKYFTLHMLNNRLAAYSYDHSSKPSFFQEEHIKSGKNHSIMVNFTSLNF